MSEDAERYARIHAALEGARKLKGDHLEAYLEDACLGDDSVRVRVLELLATAKDDADDLFADKNVESARRALDGVLDRTSSSLMPDEIRDYKIIRKLGHGGMGVVYEAEQQTPRRRVAVKLLHPMHTTPHRLRRFRQEAELLGRLQHSGIAQIFESSTFDLGHGPQPFFAMELVHGLDIIEYCNRNRLDRLARMTLLARVADAVQYAHDQGIIHRDLKPDNVLVDSGGNPRVLDFGIARATESNSAMSTDLTKEGQIVGTLAYIAPEQLLMRDDAVTPKVDVYALGVLGFELLVGRLPHQTEALPTPQAIAHLTTCEAPRASLFDLSLRGDLETILGKALDSETNRRYASAGALASDLRRYLEHRPIQARPPSRVYLARKFVKRNKTLVIGAAATLMVAIVGALIATNYAIEANRHAREVDRRADRLERANYISGIAAASSAIDNQDYASAGEHLDGVPEIHRGWEYEYLRAKLIHHVDDWETPLPVISAPVFDEARTHMFAVLQDGSIGKWEVPTGRFIDRRTIDGLRVDPYGTGVLLHGLSRRFAAVRQNGDIVLGDLETGQQTGIVDSKGSAVMSWGHAEEEFFYACDRDIKHWNGKTSQTLISGFSSCTYNPVMSSVALTGGRAGTITLLDVASREFRAEVTLDDAPNDLAFSPDGRLLAVAGNYRNVYLLDASNLKVIDRLLGHQREVLRVTWSHDSSRLISTSEDGTARAWSMRKLGFSRLYVTNVRTSQEISPPQPPLPSASVTPDGRHALVAAERVRLFPLDDPNVLRGHGTYVYYLTFSPDGTMLASSAFKNSDVHVWSVAQASLLWKIQLAPAGFHKFGGAPMVAFSEDGSRLVVSSNDETINQDVQSRAILPVTHLTDPVERLVGALGVRPWGGPTEFRALSPDGQTLALCRGDVLIFDRIHFEETPGTFRSQFVRFNDQEPIGRLEGHFGLVHCVTFSPDGRRIATGGNDGTVRIWDAQTFEQLLVLRGHEQYVQCVAFSPDGTMVASASGDTTIRLWDTKPLHERRARSGN